MGRPKLCNPCCGGGFGGSSSSSSSRRSSRSSSSVSSITAPTSCCVDGVEAAQYAFSISGSTNVGGSGCTTCSNVNGDWVVTWQAPFSEWRSSNFTSCTQGIFGNSYRWSLSMECVDLVAPVGNDHNRITLICNFIGPGVAMVSYRADVPMPADCLSPIVLNKLTEPGVYCTGFPASVTIFPQ